MSTLTPRTLAPSLALATLGAGLALTLAAAPAAAQVCTGRGGCDAAALRPGDLLRIRTDRGRDSYRLVASAGDTLVVTRPRRSVEERIPLARVERLERSLGRHSRGRGFARGAAIGGLAGLATGALVGAAASDDEPDYILTDGQATGLLAVVGGLSFATIGGIVGAIAPGQRWAAVATERRLTVAPMHGGLGVRVAF